MGAYSTRHIEVLLPASADTTPPTPNITVGPDRTKVSANAPYDSANITFTVDEDCQAWKVKIVPSSGSANTAGTLIESGGSVSSGGTVNVNITEAEMIAASAVEGANIVKVFVQDLAGNWSV